MDVHARLARHLLVDGYHLVLDLERSQGPWLVDARDGRRYLDFYTFFASAPLGVNPPFDPDFTRLLGQVAREQARQLRHLHRASGATSSTPSPGCSVTPPCRTCSSWRAARWPSRTP